MSRTPGNADKLLIDAGKKIVSRQGCTGLRIREVADRAGVNLGMFHYHFQSKKRFTRLILQEIYEDFFSQLTVASRDGKDAISQLRNTLLAMARFVRDHREFYGALVKDVMNGDPEMTAFIRANAPRHATILTGLVMKSQKEGSLVKIPLPEAMGLIMAGLNFPIVMAGVLRAKYGNKNAQFVSWFEQAITDRAIERRLDMILKGMRPE
jgi:AcrR family transcriptional regulator